MNALNTHKHTEGNRVRLGEFHTKDKLDRFFLEGALIATRSTGIGFDDFVTCFSQRRHLSELQ